MATAVAADTEDLTMPQTGRLLNVSIASVPKDALAIERFTGTETMSGIFQFKLELLANAKAASNGMVPPLKDILGKSVTVSMLDGDSIEGERRYFHGIIGGISNIGYDDRFSYYHAQMVPWLWLLMHKRQSRIFQQKTVIDILQEVFKGTPSDYVKFRKATTATYPDLDYCVQYQETDFNFVSRLMQRDGISYFFEHAKDGHTLVFTDTNQGLAEGTGKGKEARYFAGGRGDGTGMVTQWRQVQQIRPAKYTLRDQHFRDPKQNQEQLAGDTKSELENYDHFGDHASPFNLPDRPLEITQEGERLATVRIQETSMTGEMFQGFSTWRHFITGYKFSLSQHPTLSGKFIPVLARHNIHQSPDYISGRSTGQPYQGDTVCVRAEVPVRSIRTAEQPVIPGLLTATVTVANGADSCLDEFGRVRVQFHWDRQGQNDEKSTCWIRVAQPWADGEWGMHFWPRKDQEVVVQFVEGDPDRPVVTGCLFHASNMPPYELPANYHRSGWKTRSTPGAGKDEFNEIRMQDLRGKEQLFCHAQKDMDIFVKNDHRTIIGANQHLIVTGLQNESISGDHSREVKGNHMEKIGAKFSLQVGDSQHQTVGHVYTLQAGDEIHLKSGTKIVLESQEVSLKGAGGFVDIGRSGVAIQGTVVDINSGGSAASGTSASPDAPKVPVKADDGQYGGPQPGS